MKEISLNELHQSLFPGVPYQIIIRIYSTKPDFGAYVSRMLSTGQITYVQTKTDWYGIYGAIHRSNNNFHSKQIAKNLTAIAATVGDSTDKPLAELRERMREIYPDWNFSAPVSVTEVNTALARSDAEPVRPGFGYLPQKTSLRQRSRPQASGATS